MTNKAEERYNKAQEYLLEFFEHLPKGMHCQLSCVVGTLGEFRGRSEGLRIAVKQLRKLVEGGK